VRRGKFGAMRATTSSVERSAKALAEDRQRAHQAEVVERLRPQLDRDPANVLQARPSLLLDLDDVGAQRIGNAVLQSREHQQHRGQLLTHLIMELLGDPQPL
jgi:hypothetical protein